MPVRIVLELEMKSAFLATREPFCREQSAKKAVPNFTLGTLKLEFAKTATLSARFVQDLSFLTAHFAKTTKHFTRTKTERDFV